METENKNKDLAELETQLSRPHGLNGIEVARRMSATNRKLIEKTIVSLGISDNQWVLEIGHGNGIHVNYVLEQSAGIKYLGIEISETMHEEAKRLNQTFLGEKVKNFALYNGTKIPAKDNSFDKIFTVNTIYFWENKKLLLSEIKRVLKHNGIFSIGYVDESSMTKLPYVMKKFDLFSDNKVKKMMNDNGFVVVSKSTDYENITNNMGDLINRKTHIMQVKIG